MHIVFTTLAMNQTKYFVELSKSLIDHGYSASIICFHEDSVPFIKSANIECFNVFEAIRNLKFISSDEPFFSEILTEYKINNPNILLSHEKVAFNAYNTKLLKLKFVKYFFALEGVFQKIKNKHGDDVVLFQELGGFASIISSFFVAKKYGYDNVFLEPSFFKGRMFFVKNSFESFKISESNEGIILSEVENYLKDATNSRTIVIPTKDSSHYRHPIKKIINFYNFKRLIQKTISKYLFGRNEEFNHIGNYVFRHIRMLVNRFLFIKYYKEIPSNKFIYYPFHVPNDVALTVRAPLFVDQYFLIDYISRCIPNGYTLAIKEHPAMIGMVEYSKIKELLLKNDNIVFLRPEINNHDVMKEMKLLITVNSKTGAESLLYNKKVICLGDAFYKDSSCVEFADNISTLSYKIWEVLEKPSRSIETNSKFFSKVYANTFPGELYDISSGNINKCVESFKLFLNYKS